MFSMVGNFPNAAIPSATVGSTLISVDLSTLAALGGGVLVALLAAFAVRLLRRSPSEPTIRLKPARVRRAAA